ncbi:MAG: phage portal protein [Vicinamibacterales bacterium]
MGALAKLSAVSPRATVSRGAGAGEDFWYVPDGWVSSLAMAGVGMSPELALTLSHVHCAVDTISADFGTMTCQMFRDEGEAGRSRVKFSDPGIGGLAYRLRWQPNAWQSAKAFWSTLAWQYLLRPACYAEIAYRPGSDSIIDQLLPRHPDRVEQQRLPSGRLTFKLREADGSSRFVTQDEMFVVRNTSTDGLNAISRTHFGGAALGTGLRLQQFTAAYFSRGATAALLATYKGGDSGMSEEEEERFHRRITRYVSGAENAGGIFLTDEDLDVKSLGVEPEKAQLLGLKDLSGRDVARLFKMPPHKLGIAGTQTYASQIQSAQEYVSGCQMPMVVEFEQAIYIHLIVARDFYAKFNMDYLLRASFKERMEGYEIGIRSRVLRPSEARVREDMNPDPDLDRLSALDHRPGSSSGNDRAPARRDDTQDDGRAGTRRADVRATLVTHDNALRVLRREREAVRKLAKKHEHDADAWRAGLRDFYADHARFTGETLRLPMAVARAVAAQHGALLEAQGLPVMDDHWEKLEAEELTTLALADDPAMHLFEGACS